MSERLKIYNYEIIVNDIQYNVIGTIIDANDNGLLIACNGKPVFVTNKRYVVNNLGLYNG